MALVSWDFGSSLPLFSQADESHSIQVARPFADQDRYLLSKLRLLQRVAGAKLRGASLLACAGKSRLQPGRSPISMLQAQKACHSQLMHMWPYPFVKCHLLCGQIQAQHCWQAVSSRYRLPCFFPLTGRHG